MSRQVLDLPQEIECELNFKRGVHLRDENAIQIRKNYAPPEICSLTVNEGYQVFRAKVIRKITLLGQGVIWSNDEKIFAKPTINHRQHQYLCLEDENFMDILEDAWKKCRQPGRFRLQLFVFLLPARAEMPTITTNIRRASQQRIQAAAAEIREYISNQESDTEVIGDLAQRVWAQERARQVNQDQELTPPDHYTFRQAQALDCIERGLDQEINQGKVILDVQYKEDGPHIPMIFSISQLRRAVGLPVADVVREILQRHTVENNVVDVDHILSDE